MAIKPTDFIFFRTELRVMQAQCKGNNEQFLEQLAILVGNLTQERDDLKNKLGMAEHQLRVIEQGGE